MKYIILFMTILCFFTSCSLYDMQIIKSIINDDNSAIIIDDNSVRNKCLKRRIIKKNNYYQIPISLEYEKKDRLCRFVIQKSNYKIQKFTFRPIELRNAKIFTDSIFNSENRFEYVETNIQINCISRNKLIGIVIRSNNSIIRVYESLKGNQFKLHQKFDILEFDGNGNLLREYKEYLY